MRAPLLAALLALALPATAGRIEVPGAKAPLVGRVPALSFCPVIAPPGAAAAFSPGPLNGLAVRPQLVTLDEAAARQAEENRHLPLLRRDVARAMPALERSVEAGDWNGPGTTLDAACCGDAAPKLAYLLRKAGHPAHVVEAELHFYVLVQLAKGRLVVDPTFRQFFGGAHAPADIPRAFVGTYEQLYGLLEARRADRTSSFSFNRIYFSEAEIADRRLAAIAESVERSPDAAENRALLDFDGARPSN